jgi:transposase
MASSQTPFFLVTGAFAIQARLPPRRIEVESSRTVAEVARDHGIGSETLRNWVNAYRRDHPDELPEISEPERAELARLRKEVRELKAEREFLGKAAAFFAKEFR